MHPPLVSMCDTHTHTVVADSDKRVEVLRDLVARLPPENITLLHILIQHLNRSVT